MEEKVAHALMQAGGHFVSAVNSSVMFAKAQTKVPDCTLGKVVLCGGAAQLRGFAEYLESNLNVPVEVFDPMQHLDLSGLGAEQQNAIKQDQGGMTVAVGLAMLAADERSTRVMILPEDEKKKRAFREKTVFMIGAAVVVVVGLAVGWSMRSSARAAGKDERAKLEQRKQQYEKQAGEYAAAVRRVDVVTQQRDALRRQVALGPGVQLVLDTVQGVLNPKGGQGFDEIFIENTQARMNRVSEKDADGNEHSFEAAEVTLQGVVLELGSRPVATTHSDFMSALQRTLKENGGLVLASDSGLQQQTRAFKIVIRQMRTPEQVSAERAAGAEKKE
jgi:cell division ATPase FtsA